MKFFEKKDKKTSLPILLLEESVLLPGEIKKIELTKPYNIAAIEQAKKEGDRIIISFVNKTDGDKLAYSDVGVEAMLLFKLFVSDTPEKIHLKGFNRVLLDNISEKDTYFTTDFMTIDNTEDEIDIELLAYLNVLKKSIINTEKFDENTLNKISANNLFSANDLSKKLDFFASILDLKTNEKLEILENISLKKRITFLLEITENRTTINELEKKIEKRIKGQINENQKNYYLNEKIKAIQKELGQDIDFNEELEEIKNTLENGQFPKEVKSVALKELKKLKMMQQTSSEAVVSRNYIDWLISLPWEEHTTDKLNIIKAKKILDKNHYGMDKVKERIIEYLAVKKLSKNSGSNILCFIGSPGVGKTSLGISIADALGKKFVRIALGGVRDEAEIRGHRRTYVGALPGKIIQGIKSAGVNNPVFLMDEIDKLSSDYKGDPTSALLEVLDPEQNKEFLDNYIGIPFDLSQVLFITTANYLPSIPPPLRDRMEIIKLDGYTEQEKFEITKQHLIPRQIKKHGLKNIKIEFNDDAISEIINNYTREAGVRSLEKNITKILRKISTNIVYAGKKPKDKIIIDKKSIENYLGIVKYKRSSRMEETIPGIVNGLAWTEYGGEILTIETTVMKGTGKITITGKLGEVMQESAQAAISYIRSRSEQLNIDYDFYKEYDIHIHVPEGATPKEGPSAGIGIAVSIASALTKQNIENRLALTGEITLSGRVLPIGGLKEKLLAAVREGIEQVIIPKENEDSLSEIEDEIKNKLTIHKVSWMDEVTKLVFGENKNLIHHEKQEINNNNISLT